MTHDDLERCGEYVLGLLDGHDRQAFEARLAAEPDLAAAVARLERQMHALDDTAGAAPVDPALWAKIDAQLDSAPADSSTPAFPSASSQPPPADNDNAWLRRTAMAASVVVALGLGFAAGNLVDTQPQPLVIAVLLNESDAQPGAIIEAFADDTVRLVPLDTFVPPQNGVYQLWTLPDQQTGPVSLGTLDDTGTMRISGPDLPRPEVGQLYEITLEPPGGSPTGKPTGPILVKGFAKSPV
ncbi:anti-sigma factor domain-containing protein [Devosia sp.]|uniref:anti-sigma factor n=1 Tax=Devosia sp. TaxID=1871048 RepID=UPI003A90FFC7